jgi:P-type Mg2+ transporter
MNPIYSSFWNLPQDELLRLLNTSLQGLTTQEAAKRLELYGRNELKTKKRFDSLTLLLAQFKSPIILLLIFAAGLSLFLHDSIDAVILLVIILLSGLLAFWQERGAANAVERLIATIETKVSVRRDGKTMEIPLDQVVPGDIVLLDAGAVVPGDCLLLERKDLFVDESSLTGETFPAEKSIGILEVETALAHRSNTLFMGTHVISGVATAVVVKTGKLTEFGKISERLRLRIPETEFEHGVKRFGYFLMEITLFLVLTIFGINVYLKRPVIDSFLFSLGLAVGLTPQLLPAIISINLAQGAKRMAEHKVIVKRLACI